MGGGGRGMKGTDYLTVHKSPTLILSRSRIKQGEKSALAPRGRATGGQSRKR